MYIQVAMQNRELPSLVKVGWLNQLSQLTTCVYFFWGLNVQVGTFAIEHIPKIVELITVCPDVKPNPCECDSCDPCEPDHLSEILPLQKKSG